MVQYLVTYSILTGQEQNHYNWLCDVGMNYFKRQPGFKQMRTYSTLIGSGPDWVMEIDFDSPEDLVKALDTDEAKRILEDFEHLVDNLSTKVVVPTAETISAAA